MDADGFLGEADLEHWYGVNRALLETGGFDAVSLEQVKLRTLVSPHSARLIRHGPEQGISLVS
jgi:hypothetical protein